MRFVINAPSTAKVIIRSPTSLDILSGAVVNSYADNVLTGGDAPTIVPTG